MTTFLLMLMTAVPCQAPPTAPPPSEAVDAAALAAWVADLDSKDVAKKKAAHQNLMKAGPKAKAAVPDLIKLASGKIPDSLEAVDILGAIGPDAKDAMPVLVGKLEPAFYNVGPLVRLVEAICKIEGPRIETTRAMLQSSTKGFALYLSGSGYLLNHTAAVVDHLATLADDRDPKVRVLAATALGNLAHTVNVGTNAKPDWKPMLTFAGDRTKVVPVALEKLLGDEVVAVRIEAGKAIAQVSPQIAEKCIPVVLALAVDGRTWEQMPPYLAAQILRPVAEPAFRRLLPLFDCDAKATRDWAIQVVADLPVQGPLEVVLKESVSARMREAAAAAFGLRRGTSAVPLLTTALADPAPSVRLAVAHALVQIEGAKAAATGAVIAVLTASLKREESPVRWMAAHDLVVLGPPARSALASLHACLQDATASVALEAALAIAAIDPAAADEAIPVLIKGLRGDAPAALRVAEALGTLGPAAAAAVPEMAALLESKNLELRLVVAVATARIDPATGAKAAAALTTMVTDPKLRYSLREKAILGLIRIGPAAKPAASTLLTQFAEKNAMHKAELAVAAAVIDPEAASTALVWLREHLRPMADEQTYDILEFLPMVGNRAKLFLPELTALLLSKTVEIRMQAVEALRAIGPDAKDALPRLKELAATDPRPHIRVQAAAAIEAIIRAKPSK